MVVQVAFATLAPHQNQPRSHVSQLPIGIPPAAEADRSGLRPLTGPGLVLPSPDKKLGTSTCVALNLDGFHVSRCCDFGFSFSKVLLPQLRPLI